MIESDRDAGTFEVFCDQVACPESQEYDTDGDWQRMIAQMKSDGWLILKEESGYSHTCPGCREGMRKKRV